MLEKKEMYIRNLLENDQDFQELEGQICDLIPVKLDKKGLDDENIQKLIELEQIIIEKAFLTGFRSGMKEYDKVIENPEKHISAIKLFEIFQDIKKPATKAADFKEKSSHQ